MASLTIRNIDERTKRRLRIRAAENGRSMEEEARTMLKEALQPKRRKGSWAHEIVEMFQEIGGAELETLPRQPMRDPPDFSKW